MYKIVNKDGSLVAVSSTLNSAMEAAKSTAEFVTITGPDFEVCGVFGVDSVENGLCPDGIAYDWNKAARIGRVKKERV